MPDDQLSSYRLRCSYDSLDEEAQQAGSVEEKAEKRLIDMVWFGGIETAE